MKEFLFIFACALLTFLSFMPGYCYAEDKYPYKTAKQIKLLGIKYGLVGTSLLTLSIAVFALAAA